MDHRHRAEMGAEDRPEGSSGSRQARRWTYETRVEPIWAPAGLPAVEQERSTTGYVPFSRAGRRVVARKGDRAERAMNYLLLGSTVLVAVLVVATIAGSVLGGESESQGEPVSAPGITNTPAPAVAQAGRTGATIATLVTTGFAGTPDPYADGRSPVTPGADATRYTAPGYRHTFGDPSTGSGSDRDVADATPSLLVPVTALGTSDAETATTAPGIIATTSATAIPGTPSSTAVPTTAAPQGDDLPACICDADTYDCGDPLARACFDTCRALGRGDVHRLDPDRDGVPCGTRTVATTRTARTTVPAATAPATVNRTAPMTTLPIPVETPAIIQSTVPIPSLGTPTPAGTATPIGTATPAVTATPAETVAPTETATATPTETASPTVPPTTGTNVSGGAPAGG